MSGGVPLILVAETSKDVFLHGIKALGIARNSLRLDLGNFYQVPSPGL